MKWDGITYVNEISLALMKFLTTDERQKALKISYGDLTEVIRKSHRNTERYFDGYEIKGYSDKVTVKVIALDKTFEMTWNKAAKAIHKQLTKKDDSSDNLIPIEELDLSVRAFNRLYRYGIRYVSDFEKTLKEETKSGNEPEMIFSKIGKSYVKEFYNVLDKYLEENEDMAGIDFRALKNARKAVEDKVEENIPEELESSYTSVWGGQKESIIQVEVTRIVPYTDENGNSQPYKLNENRVEQIAASAKDIGIVTPLTVRKKGDTYEMISGHHRLAAAKSIGQLKVPCIVKSYSDDEMFKVLAESNIQRDKILPSEYGKIFARYMELRADEETTSKEIADKFNVSKKTMYRYLDINKLSEGLQNLFDEGIINIGAVEYIKGFSESVQNALYEALSENGIKLSLVLAKRVREFVSDCDELTAEDIVEILTVKEEPKKRYKSSVYNDVCGKYKVEMSESELDELTVKLLEEYFKSKEGNV